MDHMPGCPAKGQEDDGLYHLGELDTTRPDWREYAQDLFEVREELGCRITRFIADQASGSRTKIEEYLDWYDTNRDSFLMMAALVPTES